MGAGKRGGMCSGGPEPFSLVPDMQPCQSAAPGLVAVNWWGVLLPAGTPRPIVNKLNPDTVKALQDPEGKKRFAALGVQAVSSSPEPFPPFTPPAPQHT